MDEFKVILVMNEATIRLLQDKNEDCHRNIKIKEYLEDEALFFKIDKTTAYKILQNVGVKQDKIENTYKKLIDRNMFYNLLRRGKIKANDNKLIIKYDIYSDNLFKKNN